MKRIFCRVCFYVYTHTHTHVHTHTYTHTHIYIDISLTSRAVSLAICSHQPSFSLGFHTVSSIQTDLINVFLPGRPTLVCPCVASPQENVGNNFVSAFPAVLCMSCSSLGSLRWEISGNTAAVLYLSLIGIILRWGFLIWELIFIHCWLFFLILVGFFFVLFLFSLRFGQISPLAFFRWFTATSDRNAESCNRIPSNNCLP